MLLLGLSSRRRRCSSILSASRSLGIGCTGRTGTETQFSKRINSMASMQHWLPTHLWQVNLLGLAFITAIAMPAMANFAKCKDDNIFPRGINTLRSYDNKVKNNVIADPHGDPCLSSLSSARCAQPLSSFEWPLLPHLLASSTIDRKFSQNFLRVSSWPETGQRRPQLHS